NLKNELNLLKGQKLRYTHKHKTPFLTSISLSLQLTLLSLSLVPSVPIPSLFGFSSRARERMATISRSRQALESRSGGKIVRPRRVAGARTPYDRPRLANPGPENPNWFSRLIYSPTRMIASGAGKIISSVFSPDSSSSSSSEDGTDDEDVDDDDISTQEDDGLNKRNGTSGKLSFFRKEPPATLGKSDNKHVIEQLLMQETFS
ncbi:Protein KAKU4, partial [Prunus dulcis]